MLKVCVLCLLCDDEPPPKDSMPLCDDGHPPKGSMPVV